MQVLVIGAGVIGCAVAFELASRGADVELLDARQTGAGATQASAGILAPHVEGHSPGLLELGLRSLERYDAFVDRARTESGLPIEYRRTGTLEVAFDAAQAAVLRAAAARHDAAGVDHRYLDAAEARALEPGLAPDAAGALLVASHGYVQARALVAALESAARRKGAVVRPAAPVDALRSRGNRVEAVLAGRTITADAAVLAAGSWSGQLVIERAPAAPVKPVRGQLLELACDAPPAARVLWSPGCYLVPWQDGTVLVGATSEDVGFDERATVAAVEDLLRAARVLLPSMARAAFREVRVGLRPATQDELPVVGRSAAQPRVVYATGHYRNGVLLAPLTAAAVAGLLLDGREAPELTLTTPARFGL